MNMDRRGFVKGGVAAAGMAALAAAGLAGCAPTTKGATAEAALADTGGALPAGFFAEEIEGSCVELEPITEFATEETFDIVVVGAGCSGVPAILTALEEGATVGVLQKEATASANGNGCSAVIKGHSTPAGINRWMSDWAKENKWRLNMELFNYYVDHSEETLSWIVQQSESVDFGPATCRTSGTIAYDDGSMLASASVSSASNDELMKKLAEKAESLGAVFHYSTPAVQLVMDEAGAVTGVIGKDAQGAYHKLNSTKAVIMAAGDYMNNEAMLKRYSADSILFGLAQANRTGDGHILAATAGGRIVAPCHPKQIHDLGSSGSTFMGTPFLALDPDGNRFFNEECVMTSWNVVMKYYFHEGQPTIYRFFDSEYGTKYKGVGQVPPVEVVEKNLAVNDETGRRRIFKGNTIEEICEQLDLDAAAFKASVDRYNELCAQGHDDDFGKRPEYMQPIVTAPFYCIESAPRLSAINGGVCVDGHYQVTNADGEPIPGLFAVGVNGGDVCGGIDWSMPGGLSNCHCFNAGRYSVIYALTGDLVPSNPCSFDQIAEKFKGEDGTFTWDNPEKARHEIEVW